MGVGNTIGRIQVEAPALEEFVVRATLPVPPSTFPRLDGMVPFAVRDSDQSLLPTQIEEVTRFANDLLGADVVEISARVKVPAGAKLGDPLSYDIVFSPHPREVLTIDPSIRELLDPATPIVMRSRDVFGNVYELDLLANDLPKKVMRNGKAMFEWRAYGSLEPIAPRNGTRATLPHLMGVHVYFRLFDGEPVLQMDLRVHNGHSGLDKADHTDDPLDKIYFDSIELVLPGGWKVYESFGSPTAGPTQGLPEASVYSVVSPVGDGSLHVMPRQSQFMRRLTIAQQSNRTRALTYAFEYGLGFSRYGNNEVGERLYSWWNPDTAHYYPQRRIMPTLDHIGFDAVRDGFTMQLETIASHVAEGTPPGFPIVSGGLGWAHPWGIDHGGMGGGTEIFLFDGIRLMTSASRDGYRAQQLKHRMYTERQPNVLYNANGEPSSFLQWITDNGKGPWTPVWHFLIPFTHISDPFGFTAASTHQVDLVQAVGLQPAYEPILESFKAIDFEHFVRYTQPAKLLLWIGNDSLAKDSLLMQAEIFRMSYNAVPYSEARLYVSSGLGADRNFVADHPGVGIFFGRLEGWGMDAVLAAYSSQNRHWRGDVRDWLDRVLDVVDNGQADCSGIIQASVYGQFFDGNYRARQSIEQAIVENMLVALANAVYRAEDQENHQRTQQILERSLYSMVSGPAWVDSLSAPAAKLAVGELDVNIPPFCNNAPPDGVTTFTDTFQVWSSFAYAFEITGDSFFLQRAAEMAGTSNLLGFLENVGLENLGNRMALLALVQGAP